MKIKVSKIMKAKAEYTSQRETAVTSSFRACSFAMDDGGRCLLDVINDPLLLQSFLESGSDENSKDPHDGTSSESAVESPQVPRSSHAALSNHLSSVENIVERSDQMGYSYAVDTQGLLAQSGLCSNSPGLGGVSLVVASSAAVPTYHHASSSGATIHHRPSVAHASLHPHSPASAQSSSSMSHSIKSPGQGPSSVHSMPPPSPVQQIKSPLTSHTPSPAPAWSPVPPVLSPATSRSQSTMPSVAFQQSHNQVLQTSCSVTQFVTALATQQSITQKLSLQQQQQLFLQQQLSPASQQQQPAPRLTAVSSPMVTTTAVAVTPPMVQLIQAPQSNVSLPIKPSHTTVRPIQPKLPPQILPKPAGAATNQFVAPAPSTKQATPTPVTAAQRTVGVGIQPGAASQLVIGQGQPSVFPGPQGTIVLNQIIPGVGQSPILIQGNLGNLANLPGLQLTLRPQSNASTPQPLNTSASQNNATLIAALQGPSQHAQTLFAQAKSPLHGQQTIVIPNNIAHASLTPQNINLTSTAIPNSSIMSSSSQGQGFLARSNIILSPRVVGPNQGIQLQQIQTPQGQIIAFAPSQTIAVPHLQAATLGSAQLAPVTVPMHGVMATGQGVLSGLSLQSHPPPPSALQQQQSLFGAAVPFTSHLEQSSPQVIQVPQPLAPQQVPTNHPGQLQQNQQPQPQHVEQSPKPSSPPKPSKVPSVNLEELLKEHGIVPENSPPPSPDSNSSLMEEPPPQQLQAPNTVVPSPQLITALQSQQVVLEQLSQNSQGNPAIPQLKLALTQDGSVILQPHTAFTGNPRMPQYMSSPQVQGRISNSVGSVIFPTVTTSAVSVPVVATDTSTSQGHSALIARLNAGPAVSVPDVVTSLALASSLGGSTTTSITTTTITTTTATLVPLTVQSLNVNSSPIASSYIVQRANTVPVIPERVFMAETVVASASPVITSVVPSTCSLQGVQSVQNKVNHATSTFQTIVVPSDNSSRTTAQIVPKAVQSCHVQSINTANSQSIVQAEVGKSGCIETHLVEIAESGAIVPSHNIAAFSSGVPNQVLQNLPKDISDLITVKYHTPEQQKSIQQLITVQQKITGQNKQSGKTSRTNQSQIQIRQDAEVEKLVQKVLPSQNVVDQAQQQQQAHVKVTTQNPQQHVLIEKQQTITNSKVLSAHHSAHVVNILKQNSQNTPVKHIIPATTSVTTVCDSTSTANVVTLSSHHKVVNQITTAAQQRQQTTHQCNSKALSEQTQPSTQILVRVQKPVQQQSVQATHNIIQKRGPSPAKKLVNIVPKTVLISDQLSKDQSGAVNPDVKTPFLNKSDACSRLLKYHVFNSKVPSLMEIHKADETFDMISVQLFEKIKRLKNKFHFLQLKESMRPCSTPERVLMERIFLDDERAALQADRSSVAEGKTLSLPPPPQSWLKQLKSLSGFHPLRKAVKIEPARIEPEHNDHSSETGSDVREDGDLLGKEDSDNLEAPVIDSCADILVPPHDDNCERSPPTLKRIVIKQEKHIESDSEETVSKKRQKLNNSCIKTEPVCDWSQGNNTFSKPPNTRTSEKTNEVISNHKYPHTNLCHRSFYSDKEDMMSKIRKELNISPMEMDEDEDDTVSSHVVDFDPPSGANGLDFEPPLVRTEESCDPALLSTYNNSIRTNCEIKYDFDMLGCTSEWAAAYVHQVVEDAPNESEVAVESILSDQHNPSDLDLSGLDGLTDHLEDSQNSIPNGIQDDMPRESEIGYARYRLAKHKRFHEQQDGVVQDQVQSAIKSILGVPAENRSYFGANEVDLVHRVYTVEKKPGDVSKHAHNTHITDYTGSLDAEIGVPAGETDAALDEAVRSILL